MMVTTSINSKKHENQNKEQLINKGYSRNTYIFKSESKTTLNDKQMQTMKNKKSRQSKDLSLTKGSSLSASKLQ